MRNIAGVSASDNGKIYHLLSRALREGVAIAQIIDLNILDVVSICNVDLGVQFGRTLGVRGRLGFLCGIIALTKIIRGQIEAIEVIWVFTERIGGTSTC